MNFMRTMNWKQSIRQSSLATLAALGIHFALGYWQGYPFLTDGVAEWIMARTPSAWAVPLLESTGAWAKPFAATGGLAALGFVLWLALLAPIWWMRSIAVAILVTALGWAIDYRSLTGLLSFVLPAMALLARKQTSSIDLVNSSRRELLTSAAMSSGIVLVATEAWWRNERLAAKAIVPVPLFRWSLPAERVEWGKGLVRKPITPIREFYVMSKNTVDPVVDPKTWRLKILLDDQLLREFSYAELLSLPRQEQFVTLRCVSNTLKSDLMGTAAWSGIRLNQLVRASEVPAKSIEMAVIGLDGHGDSLRIDYAFSGEPLFALGMNGETLNRNHGFPIRLLTPRYYGFKSIKWIDEIRFSSQPYVGTWPKLGFTKEPIIHTASFVDRIVRDGDKAKVGGVSFAGVRGVNRVQLRAGSGESGSGESGSGEWIDAELESPISPFTLTRWKSELALPAGAEILEARAMDGEGNWQGIVEKPLFPDGVSGPTTKRIPGL